MVIRSNLFNRGHPLKAEAGLSDVLENHKHGTLKKIREISDLDQMVDSFLERLVKDSLVEPLVIQFDKMTRKLRTETLDASYLPAKTMGARRFHAMGDFPLEGGNQKQVARLTIPFSGDPTLLKFAPNPCGMTSPQGEVNDHTVQFDVILWGAAEDAQRVRDEIQKNRDLIADCSGKINKQVKEFNESLPAQVKAAFTAKLDELTKQHAVFDDLGIPEEPEPPPSPRGPITQQAKKGKARAVQIIQNIETMFVQQLNQTNYNVGDVNNAVQSGE
jgi:hypothetical protein